MVRSTDDDDPTGALASGDPVAAMRLGLSVQLHSELRDVLGRIAYLGPIRSRPDRTAELSTIAYRYVGPHGEHTTPLLADDPALVERTIEWFDRLGLGYHIRIVTPSSEDVSITAGDFAVLGLIDTRDEARSLVSSRAVGYGISQITPIVVQSVLSANGMLLIEQPEVHIHPRLQAEVGDLLIHTVKERRNQVLVETHSEHLVLRLLRRVREGVIGPADISILYVDLLADGAAHVRKLDVDSAGELVEESGRNWGGYAADSARRLSLRVEDGAVGCRNAVAMSVDDVCEPLRSDAPPLPPPVSPALQLPKRGAMDGAVRAGNNAAAEVLASLTTGS